MTGITRRGFLKAVIAALGAYALTGSLDGYGDVELARLDVGLGVRILFLPDIHLHHPGERDYVARLVESESPDVLILGGDQWDMLTGGLEIVERFLERLRAHARHAVMVLGNHEYKADSHGSVPLRDAVEAAESLGYAVLRDDKVAIGGLIIAGVDWRDDPRDYSEALRRVGEADVLASHSPDVFHHVTGRQRVVLAGHTHGGQVCLPGARSIATNSRYGYSWGLYKRPGSVMYLPRGLGEMVPPRLFCRRQAVALS